MNSTNKIVKFDISARDDLLKGVDILANAVKVTMGPRGRNVVIQNGLGMPILTKDGVTVAKAVNLKDEFLNLGVQMIKEAASRTADIAGDGTTTSTVLSQAIFAEGVKMLAAGFQAADLKRGIEHASKEVIENLKEIAIPVSHDHEIEQVGTISANGESQIGKLLVDALNAVGREGVITVEEAKGFATSLTVVEGLQFNRGYLSPYFVTNNEKMIAEFQKPLVLICNKGLTSMKEIMTILEKALNAQRSLLIIADDIDGDALQGLVVNKLRGSLQVCATRTPGFGEHKLSILEDMAALLNTQVYNTTDKLEEISLESLGECKRALIGKAETTLIECKGNQSIIEKRAASLRQQLRDKTLDENEIEILKSRLSKLIGGVAILRVGGATEMEMKERKDRVEDALHATQAAIEEGIVPGGGVALFRAAESIECSQSNQGVNAGITVIKNACVAPIRQIVKNAGVSPEVVLNHIISSDNTTGYDAYTDAYGDMFDMGIIDPLKVVRIALENAVSSAMMMLTVGCAMIEDTN